MSHGVSEIFTLIKMYKDRIVLERLKESSDNSVGTQQTNLTTQVPLRPERTHV